VLSTTGSRRRRGDAAAAAVLCLALALGLMAAEPAADQAAAATDSERALLRRINRSRRNHGLSALRLSAKLTRSAHSHSAQMARRGYTYHSCLRCVMDRSGATWRWAGENVGAGGSVRGIHRSMMRSSAHRANILKASARRMGAGVVRRSGRYWVTEIFYY
jgi:uncharacterized protein YkwD